MENFASSIDAAMSDIVEQPRVVPAPHFDAIENARNIATNHIPSFGMAVPEIPRIVPEMVVVDEEVEYSVWLWNVQIALETGTDPIACDQWLRRFREPESPEVIKAIKRQMERKRIAKRVHFGRMLEQKRIADEARRKEQAAKAAILGEVVAELELAKKAQELARNAQLEADRNAKQAARALAIAEAERKAAKLAEKRAAAMARHAAFQAKLHVAPVVEEPAKVARVVEEDKAAMEKAERAARHAAKTQERERAAEVLRAAAAAAEAEAAAKAQRKAAQAEDARIKREDEAKAKRDATAAAKLARARELKEAQAKADEAKRLLKLSDSLSRRADRRGGGKVNAPKATVQQVLVQQSAKAAERDEQRRALERITAQRNAIVAEEQRRVVAQRIEDQRRVANMRRAAAEREAVAMAMAESMAYCVTCFDRFDGSRRIAMYSKCGPTEHKCIMCLECLLQLAPPTRCLCGREDLTKIKWNRL